MISVITVPSSFHPSCFTDLIRKNKSAILTSLVLSILIPANFLNYARENYDRPFFLRKKVKWICWKSVALLTLFTFNSVHFYQIGTSLPISVVASSIFTYIGNTYAPYLMHDHDLRHIMRKRDYPSAIYYARFLKFSSFINSASTQEVILKQLLISHSPEQIHLLIKKCQQLIHKKEIRETTIEKCRKKLSQLPPKNSSGLSF